MSASRKKSADKVGLADANERERIRTELDRTVVVEAAAGTGKTTELVHRIVAVLASDRARVDSIVAVTFTEKAAGELKLRLRTSLEEARHAIDAAGRRALEDALARLEEARVGTIHAFCADLLRERSIEAAVDPRFETLTESEAERLFERAFDAWLQEKLQDPPEGVRRSLRRSTGAPFRPEATRPTTMRRSDDGPIGRLRRAGWTLASWRDFPSPWRRDPFDREAWIDALVVQLREFAELSAQCSSPDHDTFYSDTTRFRQCDADIRATEEVRTRDVDALEALFVDLARERKPRHGRGVAYGPGIKRTHVRACLDALLENLQDFARATDADLVSLLHGELAGAVERYGALKAQTGRLDFVDLLIQTRNLVRDRDDVRREFQDRFTHLFVDEFQDTDPLQAEILLLLAADDTSMTDWRSVRPVDGKLFLVADPKQSIYRFRRADIGIYLEVKEQLIRSGAASVHLTTSFRALPNVQKVINMAFRGFMDGDRTAQQSEYVPLTARRDDFADQPSVIALPVPRPYGSRGRPTKTAIEQSLPDGVGAFIDWMLRDSGWTVTDRDHPGERVPIAARHVCILMRRFDSFYAGDVTRGYVRALEAREIRYLLVGGRTFHAREEIETVRTALQAIEWPDDELSMFATLHGSLFAVGDEELFEYRQRFGRLHPFRIRGGPDPTDNVDPAADDASDDRLAPIRDALALLGDLHRRRNDRPIAETLHRLLSATRAHAGFVMRPSGEQALANVMHLSEQARAYERSGGISFRGFVERLDEDAQSRRVPEAPILEEGSDGVRIMTVHRAKGLEFPVVILADITANITPWQATRWIDAERGLCAQRIGGWSPVELSEHQDEESARDAAEGIRIAYVAATRARDILVVPTLGDGAFGGGWPAAPKTAAPEAANQPGAWRHGGIRLETWVAPLNAALYPQRKNWRVAQAAPGCPPFGNDSVVERPADLALNTEGVCPGRHVFDDGVTRMAPTEGSSKVAGSIGKDRYEVVWWDPGTLRLDRPAPFGLRQEDLLGKADDGHDTSVDRSRYETWAADRAATLERGAVPKRRVQTATVRAEQQVAASIRAGALPQVDVELVVLEADAARPGGPRFGSLVHSVLATVRLDAGEEGVLETVHLQARILGATGSEAQAAAAVVTRALAHPLMSKARDAELRGRCRRETPLTLSAADGTLVEGVVDLAFETDGVWMVVDFKTDRELDQQLTMYEQQVSIYAEAIAAATGQPSKAVLMRV